MSHYYGQYYPSEHNGRIFDNTNVNLLLAETPLIDIQFQDLLIIGRYNFNIFKKRCLFINVRWNFRIS